MSPSSEARPLRDYLRVLRARRILVLGCVVLAAGAAFVYSSLKEPEYQATTTIEFKDASQDLQAVGVPIGSDVQPEKRAAAGSSLVTRGDVVARARKQLRTGLSSSQLRSRISTEVEPDSNLVRITATTADANFAARVANEFARQLERVLTDELRARYRAAATDLRRQFRELGPAAKASATGQAYRDGISRLLTLSSLAEAVGIVRPATPPSSPSSPKPVRNTIAAAVLGLLIGLCAAFLRNALDRRLTDSHEVQHELGMPLVGYVRRETFGLAGTGTNGRGPLGESDLDAFRVLRTNFGFLAKDRDLRSVVVTSALPEEGKSTVATGLAYASAVSGKRTLLAECDFRRPVLAKRLGLPPTPGLSEFLAGRAEPQDLLRTVPVAGTELTCIVVGSAASLPSEMLGSMAFSDFLEQVSEAYDMVVLDTAPLLPVSDTLELVPQVDAALFCVRLGQTTREQAQNAKSALEHVAEIPTGLVVTGVKAGGDDDYYGYYSYVPKTGSKAVAR